MVGNIQNESMLSESADEDSAIRVAQHMGRPEAGAGNDFGAGGESAVYQLQPRPCNREIFCPGEVL